MDARIWYLTQETRKRVANAAAPFVGRWKLETLKIIDPLMHEAIEDQQRMLHEAYLQGSEDEIRQHGAAMCRGWRAAALTMREAEQPDDAYLLVEDIPTGAGFVIVGQKNPEPELVEAVKRRAAEVCGADAGVWLLHEVAQALLPLAGAIRTVRALWPEATVTGVREKPGD